MKQESNLIDLKKRILFTIFILIVYRFGTFVPIPGIDTKVLEKIFSGSASSMFGMINLFSGGCRLIVICVENKFQLSELT